MATLSEDDDRRVIAPESLPFGGTYAGHAEAQRFFSTIAVSREIRATGGESTTDWIPVHTVRHLPLS